MAVSEVALAAQKRPALHGTHTDDASGDHVPTGQSYGWPVPVTQ
jgi:hypothetical protein